MRHCRVRRRSRKREQWNRTRYNKWLGAGRLLDAGYAITAGPDGIVAGLLPPTVYVDVSSVSPHATMHTAERVRAAGAHMMDAPVSGSAPQAEQGTLAIMVCGDETTFRRVEPVLRHFGRTVTHVGGNGAGALLKLTINIGLAVQTLAFSEGLLVAERGGIDPRLAAQVMADSPIGSPMLKTRVPLLLDLPDQAWFTIRLMHKDIRLALDEAQRMGVVLPSAPAAAGVLDAADELGYAGRDIAGLHEVLAKISNEPRVMTSATVTAAIRDGGGPWWSPNWRRSRCFSTSAS
jgi:3-hydroxyisobutyrate dehydrogenase-like beta-hydroxyacid dehydrogenase